MRLYVTIFYYGINKLFFLNFALKPGILTVNKIIQLFILMGNKNNFVNKGDYY